MDTPGSRRTLAPIAPCSTTTKTTAGSGQSAREVCSQPTTRFAEMSRKSLHDTPTIQSLDRGLAILEAVAGVSGAGAAETADRSHRHRPQQRLPPGEHAAAAAVSRQPEREQRLHPRPDGLAAVTPLRAHRARHVLPPLPAGPVGDARRDVALRRPRGRRGVLHRPPHPRRPGGVGGGADRRIRAAALHRARQGAARRLRSRTPCASCSGGRRCGATRGRP